MRTLRQKVGPRTSKCEPSRRNTTHNEHPRVKTHVRGSSLRPVHMSKAAPGDHWDSRRLHERKGVNPRVETQRKARTLLRKRRPEKDRRPHWLTRRVVCKLAGKPCCRQNSSTMVRTPKLFSHCAPGWPAHRSYNMIANSRPSDFVQTLNIGRVLFWPPSSHACHNHMTRMLA